jgi:hypothetical protein
MLEELPWIDGRLRMASEVNSCKDEQGLVDLVYDPLPPGL